ncbi:MAG: undecaprenyl/decaprenyl-phosphate alpha-N-acetylglucosaminyl 1-phosphate transferase [Nitrospinae bacterium]|nr:undecaprenyl/decaprenyl-phosphate alpha-N-acetylglucosaminyl 1-phosphate transferase [Nitrospinota bacterium]
MTKLLKLFFLYLIPIFIFLTLLFPQTKLLFEEIGERWFYIFTFAFLLSYFSTPAIRTLSLDMEIIDKPDERKIHQTPTPRLGGLAVYIAFASAVIFNFHFSLELKGIAIAATLVILAGLIDDVMGLSAKIKLIVQLIAVSIIMYYGVILSFMPPVWWGNLLEIILTYIWVIGITNAMNFFDGMDGLAAGLTAIAALFISVVAIQTGQDYVMFLSIALLGSSMGFLPYNFRYRKPASIFLGDNGSTFMGFMLSSLTVMTGWATDDPVKAYTMPFLILSILIFDMTYITICRIVKGDVKNLKEWIGFVGKDHLHHRLSNLGLSNKQTVLFIYLLSSSMGVSAIILKNGRTIDAILLIIQTFLIFFIIVILMLKGGDNTKLRDRLHGITSDKIES